MNSSSSSISAAFRFFPKAGLEEGASVCIGVDAEKDEGPEVVAGTARCLLPAFLLLTGISRCHTCRILIDIDTQVR